jgi:hypothetical protein
MPREGWRGPQPAPASFPRQTWKLFMTPIKPLSVKFDPVVREQIKRISFLLDWPEGQFVNASVAVVLELIDNPAIGHVPKTIHLARHALDYDRQGSALRSASSKKGSRD